MTCPQVWQRTYNQLYRMTDSKSLQSARTQRDKYLLKVTGKEMYFTAVKPLLQYRVCYAETWAL